MPAPSVSVDLRSDTVTRPSPEMRRVIAEAEVGDMVLGDDPMVTELERYCAELLGKERSLFFPSGIMANQTALLVQAPPATEAILDAEAHILNWEDGAAAMWGGIQLRAVPAADGLLTPEQVAAAIRPRSPFLPRTLLVCLENTHLGGGGRVLPLAQAKAIAEVAWSHDVRVHLDGSRLPNAAVASGQPMRDFAAHADTVMIAISKGLGAPVGSLLAGTAETMERAWRVRRRMGGGMRQAGLLAAAGLYALQNHLPALAEDHRRARTLASRAAEIPGLSAPPPETNIVMIDLEDDRLAPDAVLAALARQGVWITQFGPRRLRAVTHRDVDDAGIDRASAALAEAVETLAG
ncbi:GntG family PLP-dependent aldolase [soil metagenome]